MACSMYVGVGVSLCLWHLAAAQWNFMNQPQWVPEGDAHHREKRQEYNNVWNPRDDGVCPWYEWRDKPDCPTDSAFPCYEPPFYPYDEIHVDIPDIGIIVGRSMSYAQFRYINVFKGIAYAKPPVQELKFKPPEDPGRGWDLNIRYWCADHYRDACPQEIWKIQDKFYEPRNMSEDCLHMNIFQPNLTDRLDTKNRNYPVFVYIHGDDYKLGDAKLYPGNVVARKEVLVVTFNYRLGALGFMTTLDHNSPGNYGLHDMIKVLEFIQRYIYLFHGDKNKVTLVGHGSGASAIGLLTLSPKRFYRNKPLFHQTIMMSGTDMCDWAMVKPIWNANARTYTEDLARESGCLSESGSEQMPSNSYLVDCLREKHFDEIVNASANVKKRYGSLAGPFGPVVDNDIILDEPAKMRKDQTEAYTKIRMMTGVTRDDGAKFVEELMKGKIGVNLEEGLDPLTFREILYDMVRARPFIRNVDEVVAAIEFEYTYWAKPDNKTAVLQNLVDMWSDMLYGWCMDAVLKLHAVQCEEERLQFCEPVYMYEFAHRSEYEPLPQWMGVPNGRDVDYLFSYPFFNDSMGNLTGVVPDQWEWTYVDKNISEFVQDMWVNFTKFSIPNTDWSRNVTWYPFAQFNLSYLHIAEWSWMDINFRQNHYAFWREYFPSVSEKWPLTTTPQPTPPPLYPYQYATWSMAGACIISLIIIATLGITLWRRSRPDQEYD